jgi:hypothetical protein
MMRLQEVDTKDKRTWVAFGLIGLGVLLLFGIGNILVPLLFFGFIVVPGLGLMAVYNTGHSGTAFFAIPGAIVTGTGAILIFQSITGYWESWTYAWTLYGVFTGLGIMMMADRLEDETLHTVGRWFVILGGVAFLGLGSLFVVFTSGILKTLLIFALIVGGIYLLTKDNERDVTNKYIKYSNGEKAKRVKLAIEDDRDIA